MLQYVVEGLDVVGGPQDFTKVALHPGRGFRVTVGSCSSFAKGCCGTSSLLDRTEDDD
jgi:hypothetical protein